MRRHPAAPPDVRHDPPNKVFDYLAAERPVALGIDGVIRDVVERAGAGVFVEPGDPAALTADILKLRAEPLAARETGMRGRDFVTRHVDRRRQAAEFLELGRLFTELREG
jgi:glycosyltransferase involved in cell wall biosynthesis